MKTKLLILVATALLYSCNSSPKKAEDITNPKEAFFLWAKEKNKAYYYRWEDLMLSKIDTITNPNEAHEIYTKNLPCKVSEAAINKCNALLKKG